MTVRELMRVLVDSHPEAEVLLLTRADCGGQIGHVVPNLKGGAVMVISQDYCDGERPLCWGQGRK